MKKIVWLAIPIALSLLSCSKDEPQNDGRLEVKLYAYMLDEAGRNAKKTSAHFYFFDASDGQQFVEERIDIPSGTEEDYRNANLTVLRMLLRDNEFPLTDGTSVVPLVVDRLQASRYVGPVPQPSFDPCRAGEILRRGPFRRLSRPLALSAEIYGQVPDCCGSRHAFSHSDGRFSQRSYL